MIAVDTNILVYAHRRDSDWHERAAAGVRGLAEGSGVWALLWPCLHEFLAIVTHPRIYDPPSPVEQAIEQVGAWLESPSVVVFAEPVGYWATLRDQLQMARITGPRVHDARVAALCMAHGIGELWTADRDFSRFVDLPVRNPLTGAS